MTTTTPTAPSRIVVLEDDPLVASIELYPTLPGEGRPTPSRTYVSPSQMKAIDRCGAVYFFKYHPDWRLREPQNSRLTLGSAVHGAAHAFFASPASSEERLLDALRAGRGIMQSLPVEVWEPQWDKGPLDTRETLDADLQRAITMLSPEWAKLCVRHVELGMLVIWRDPSVLPVFGFSDVIEETEVDGAPCFGITDLKTGRGRNANDVLYDPAVRFYAAATARVDPERPLRRRRYLVYKRTKERAVEWVEAPAFDTVPSIARIFTIAQTLTEARSSGVYLPVTKSDCTRCAYREPCTKVFGE